MKVINSFFPNSIKRMNGIFSFSSSSEIFLSVSDHKKRDVFKTTAILELLKILVKRQGLKMKYLLKKLMSSRRGALSMSTVFWGKDIPVDKQVVTSYVLGLSFSFTMSTHPMTNLPSGSPLDLLIVSFSTTSFVISFGRFTQK